MTSQALQVRASNCPLQILNIQLVFLLGASLESGHIDGLAFTSTFVDDLGKADVCCLVFKCQLFNDYGEVVFAMFLSCL